MLGGKKEKSEERIVGSPGMGCTVLNMTVAPQVKWLGFKSYSFNVCSMIGVRADQAAAPLCRAATAGDTTAAWGLCSV